MCKDTAKIRKFANMITKNRIKFIRSLEQKKYRKAHGCFVVEGPKVVEDMLPAFECEYVACTREWLDRRVPLPSACECDEVSEDELRRVSFMEHPNKSRQVTDFLLIFFREGIYIFVGHHKR